MSVNINMGLKEFFRNKYDHNAQVPLWIQQHHRQLSQFSLSPHHTTTHTTHQTPHHTQPTTQHTTPNHNTPHTTPQCHNSHYYTSPMQLKESETNATTSFDGAYPRPKTSLCYIEECIKRKLLIFRQGSNIDWQCQSEETLPEAQRTQGIESLTWAISPAK